MSKSNLKNGDIVLVDGVSGIYFNGQTTLSNMTVTDQDPDYVLRFDGQITTDTECFYFPDLEFGSEGLYVCLMQTCLRCHGYSTEIDGVLGVKTLSDLREFRKNHYLDGDTVCDFKTWKLLLTE